MLTVAILPAPLSGCSAYRLLWPLLDLQKRGEIRLLASVVVRQPNGQAALFPVGGMPFREIERAAAGGAPFGLSDQDVKAADVVVVQKAGGLRTGADHEAALLDLVKAHGRKFIYEVDDDLEAITADNPTFSEELAHNPGFVQRMRAIARACRLVTVTTPHLASVMHRTHPEVRVIPNGIDLEWWGQETHAARPPGDGPRIGWLCSRNHVEDARILVKPLRKLIARYPTMRFVLAGGFYPCLREACGDALEWHNGAPLSLYPAFARSLHLDIGLAPLVDSRFARSKSELKWIEYTALGVPTVASECGPYVPLLDHDAAALARNGAEWVSQISELVEKPEIRAAFVERARRLVEERYSLRVAADGWLRVLHEVAAP